MNAVVSDIIAIWGGASQSEDFRQLFLIQSESLSDIPNVALVNLTVIWCRSVTEDIRAYFGESVALYFSFLGFYTTALCGPAALGLLQLVFSVDTLHEYALYSLFNMLWVTVFLEVGTRSGPAESWRTG